MYVVAVAMRTTDFPEPQTRVRDVDADMPSFGHQPALDGLRGVAVVLVLLFHAGLPWLSGGYLGVSVFFTLSGYLITSLLLTEHARSGRVSLGAFYGRRMRRLLPASTLCVALIIAARAFGAFSQVEGLRGDMVGALLQSFNWVKLAKGQSYGNLFLGGISPLEHYWSLAIEEQFYWIWPALILGLLTIGSRRFAACVVVGLFVALSVTAVAIAGIFGPDAAYWATPARLPEVLAGSVLAFLLSGVRRVPTEARWLAVPSLGLIVLLSMRLPSDSGPAYEGALPLFAMLATVLIYSLQAPGPIRSVLSTRPLVTIGKVSYGLYLFHWPVFVLMRERGWDLTEPVELTAALAITAGLSAVSYRVIETPIRRARIRPRPTMVWAGVATVAVLIGVAGMAPSVSPFAVNDRIIDAAAIVPGESVRPLRASAVAAAADRNETSVALGSPPERPVRILLVGDSTLQSITAGLQLWASVHQDHARVSGTWAPGLVYLRGGDIVDPRLRDYAVASYNVVDHAVVRLIPDLQPDVVVLMTTLSDATPRKWSDSEGVISPTDTRYRERLIGAFTDLTFTLSAMVPRVVWVVPPVPLAVPLDPAPVDPAQYVVQQEVIRRVVAAAGNGVSLVDLPRFLELTGHAGRDWRPDGLHLPDEIARLLAETYLGPWLVREAVRP